MNKLTNHTGKYGKDTYYFPHDTNAKDDPKCVLLIEQLGLEGYGIYWVLIETLREQPEYKYPFALVPALARRFNTTSEKVKTVISGYQLFEFDQENFFFSSSLIRRMSVADDVRKRLSEAGKRGRNKQLGQAGATPELPLGDEKKRNEKKREERKGDIPLPFGEDFKVAWTEWLGYRKEIRKPYKSEKSIKAVFDKLQKFDEQIAVAAIQASIENQWQGLFPEQIGQIKKQQQVQNKTNFVQ